MEQEYSESYAREDVRVRMIPVYMGLIRQIDDQLGRERGRNPGQCLHRNG